MASNDLMMRIQLLVESGRSSGELRRLQKDIEGLTKSIKSLENTRITPLVRDINAIKLATAGLKGVNLNNFANELNSVKTAFAGLGVNTKALDDLRAKYTALNAAVGAGTLKTFQNNLARVKDELLQSNSAIVPLQNNIRSLRAQKGVDKSLGVDTLNSNLRVMRAELALAIDKYKELARAKAPKPVLQTALADIRQLNRDILKGNLDAAKSQRNLFNTYDKTTAQLNQQVAAQRNISALRSDEIKQLNAKIAAQKATEQSLAKEIKQLTSVANAQANARKLQLQSDLSGARGQRTGLQSRVRELEAEARAEIQRIRAVEQGTKAAARQSKQLTTLGQLFRGNAGIIKEFGSALRFALGPQMAGFAAAGSILQLFSGFFAANKEIENLNRGLNSIIGSGTLYFEELRRIANTTGQSIQTITSSFLQLVAASKGTRLEGEATRKIFEAVSRALVITGADTVRSQRAFLALAQIMSKGQVYAEELRQQLSEALPGAVQVFARALEISPQKMLELMKEGKVSSDSLLLFAMQLEKEYAILGEEMFTFSQKAAVLQNELQRLFLEIGKTGVWQAFGDALISVRDLVRDTADGVGTFSDSVVREFNAISAAFETINAPDFAEGLTKFLELLGSAYTGNIKVFLDVLKSIPAAINDVDYLLAQLGTRLNVKINTENTGIFEWINELDRKFGTTTEALNNSWNNLLDIAARPIPPPNFLQWQQQEGESFASRIRELREELEMLGGVQQRQNAIRWIVDDKSYETVANRIAQINKELPILVAEQERAYKKSVDATNAQNDALKQELETRQKQIKAQKEIQQNEKFIYGFSPRARSALNGAYETLKNYQRTSETLLRLEKESEQAMVNKTNAAKRTLDLINEIYDAEQRGRQAQEGYDKDTANDENNKLKFKLYLINQIREAEENAKKLRQGRAEAGIYFTEDQKQASQDEAQAYKLRVQATEELAKAAKETNNELKKGYLENAKFLLEEANQLYVSAGNTYLLKKNSEELLTINDQLSKTTQNQITKDRERENGLRLLAQAQKLASEAFKPEIAAPVRDTLLNQPDELAKKAQAIFADINFSKGLEDTKGLRTNISNTLEDAAGELQKKIDAAIKKFNAANQGNLEQVATALADASTLAVSLQNEIINKILGATTEAGRNQLLAELTRVQNEFRVLEKEYDQVNKRFEDAGKKPIKVPFIVDPTYMTFGESMSEQIDGVKEDVATLDSDLGKDVPKKIVLDTAETLKQHEALTAILSAPITRTVIYKAIGDIPAGGTNTQVTGSTGGYLPGYGGGDRIRALLEPGEFVLRKEAVRSIGLDQLVALNRQRVPRLSDSIAVPRMASGGAVTGAPIVINVPGQKQIRLSGSRDQAVALANLLTSVGRAA